MISGPCNGPSKGASDYSGGTQTFQKERERWIWNLHYVLFAADGLSGSAVRQYLFAYWAYTSEHTFMSSRFKKVKKKSLANKKTIKIMPQLDACQWSKAYFTGRNLAVIPWQNSHLIYKDHNNPTQMSKRGIKRGEEKIISILIFFMLSSLRSRGPTV